MSAAEIIQQIRDLPPEELRLVIAFVQETEQRRANVKYADDATAKAAMERVFEVHGEVLRRLAA